MRLLKRSDEAKRLRVEHEDDLWTLAQLGRAGRRAGMLSWRRDATTGTQEGGRAKSAERKPMWIVLEIETCEFHPFSDQLRLHGVITEAPLDKGSHHTHTVGVGDDVELSMDGGWPREDEQLLREATRASGRARAMIIVVESDEVVLFDITNHGMREVSTYTLRGGGKREAKPTKVRDAFLRQAAEKSALVLGDELPIVVCGPGMTRDQFARMLREAGCAQRTLNVATSIGGRSAANEVLAQQLADEFLGESAIAKQVNVIEEALARIATNGAVAYGPEKLTAALEQGAIETLVIVADLLRDAEANIAGSSWSDFAAGVTEGGGKLVQASTDHDSGKQLDGMGGALALLRWKIDG